MSKVISAHAVPVDGYGDTPSRVFDGFRLSGPSARIFDALAGRVGAIVAAREAAGGKDVGLMGGGVATEALKAGR